MLVEIHALQNLSPGNPNRDDAGVPKSVYFGGRRRGRISSQCLKRSIRQYPEFKTALVGHLGIRTKLFPHLVGERLAMSTIPKDDRGRIVQACTQIAKAEESSIKKAAEEDKNEKRARTPQLIFLDMGHVDEFVARLEKLRTQMPQAYVYYLNPVAGFQALMASELSNTDDIMEESAQAAVVKNAWVIAKLRLEQLRQFEGEEAASELPDEADEPGQETAEWIAERLSALSSLEGPESVKLFKVIIKAASAQEKRQLQEAEPEKPRDYAAFHDVLFEPLKSRAVDISLFGRMTTSDAFENVEACLEVAHAISTNEMRPEVDYFTAIDDLGTGVAAAHVGESHLTSNCYYKYFSLDWESFVKHLAGGKSATEQSTKEARTLARISLKELIRAAVLAMPTGKKKGHANNNPPEAVLVEVKEKHIPTSYANAFLRPVSPPPEDGDILTESIRRLGHYAGRVASGFGLEPKSVWYHMDQQPLSYSAGDKVVKKIADSEASLEALLEKVLKTVEGK